MPTVKIIFAAAKYVDIKPMKKNLDCHAVIRSLKNKNVCSDITF